MKFSTLSILALSGSAGAFAPTFGVAPRAPALEMARTPIISGNWKLNPQTREEAVSLATEIAASITDKSPNAEIALFVPYVFIEAVMGVTGDKLSVGAEVSNERPVWRIQNPKYEYYFNTFPHLFL
jgi:hypothetical protein